MLPVRSMRLALGTLLASDIPTLAPVAANKVALIGADFTPGEDLVIGDLTLLTTASEAPIPGVAGAQLAGTDPTTNEQVITNKAPAGGWRWVGPTAPNPAFTIFGLALIDSTSSVLLGTMKLIEPVTLTLVTDFFDAGDIQIRFVVQPMS